MILKIILVLSLLNLSSVRLQAETNTNITHLANDELRYIATVLSNYSITSNQLSLERKKNAEQSNIIAIQSNIILYYDTYLNSSPSFFRILLDLCPVLTFIILLIN